MTELEYILFLDYIAGITIAASIGGRPSSGPCNLMIKVGPLFSIILFLFVFKRKVALWAVIIQSLNLTTLFFVVFTKHLNYINLNIPDRKIFIWIGSYTILIILLMAFDVIVYDIKNNKL